MSHCRTCTCPEVSDDELDAMYAAAKAGIEPGHEHCPEHHVDRWMGYPGYADAARCCCGWIGATTVNQITAFGQWDRHADHYRLTDDPCTREETP